MQPTFVFDDRQLAAFDEHINGVRLRAIDAAPVFEAIADDFGELERQRFRSGASWRPDTPAWTARKAREGASLRTLVYTGTLERSLTQRGARFSRRRVTRSGVTMGTRDPVGNLLRRGTKRSPARPPVLVDETRVHSWSDWIGDYLASGRLPSVGIGL